MPEVAAYLHRALNSRLSAREWEDSIVPPWQAKAPNHGFHLRSDGRVVGTAVAFYAERDVRGRTERVCNLAAWCVDEEQRSQGLRLVLALLGQRGYHFTDLSPSGNVVALNERLKFKHLDTATTLVPNLVLPGRGVTAVADHERIALLLSGRQRQIFEDHRRAAAARHVVLQAHGRNVYVMFRKDRRKRMPVFATVLHISDPQLLPQVWDRLSTHLLLRHGALATLLEKRVVAWKPPQGMTLPHPRPRMFRSDALDAGDVDYLYSELTCVAW
ncbi:hypothetical protein [Nocardioides alpinus]|uniref:hypothetical protein n=1 Tax=Nocardioides alpinus TaxID=748909 RepID=UPI0018E37493|nr:hypothetical protein [Nocardioides alpinus]